MYQALTRKERRARISHGRVAVATRPFDGPPSRAGEGPAAGPEGSLVLGSYRVLTPLESGPYATLYAGRESGTDRRVAIKIARRRDPDGDRDLLGEELQASMRVSHPSLVRPYAAGYTDREQPVVVMQRVGGLSLEQAVRRHGPLAAGLLMVAIGQLASALEAIHAVGLAHLDVSPRNAILSTLFGRKVATTLHGFGVGRRESSPSDRLGGIGAARPLAPELLAGEPSAATDLHGLGRTLWLGLCGRRLVAGGAAADPRDVRGDVPAPVGQLVASLLDPDPGRRPDAASFGRRWAEAMERWTAPAAARSGRRIRVITRPLTTSAQRDARSNTATTGR